MAPARDAALDARAVAALLPHAPPLRLVDTVEAISPGVSCDAWWHVPTTAFWTDAHFPGAPVLPGVLVVEALAQTAALVWLSQPGASGLPVLVGLDGVRLRAPVRPGDDLALHARVARPGRLWRFDVAAQVAGRTVAEGHLLASVVPADSDGDGVAR